MLKLCNIFRVRYAVYPQCSERDTWNRKWPRPRQLSLCMETSSRVLFFRGYNLIWRSSGCSRSDLYLSELKQRILLNFVFTHEQVAMLPNILGTVATLLTGSIHVGERWGSAYKVEMQGPNHFSPSSRVYCSPNSQMPRFHRGSRITSRDIRVASWKKGSFPKLFQKHIHLAGSSSGVG